MPDIIGNNEYLNELFNSMNIVKKKIINGNENVSKQGEMLIDCSKESANELLCFFSKYITDLPLIMSTKGVATIEFDNIYINISITPTRRYIPNAINISGEKGVWENNLCIQHMRYLIDRIPISDYSKNRDFTNIYGLEDRLFHFLHLRKLEREKRKWLYKKN